MILWYYKMQFSIYNFSEMKLSDYDQWFNNWNFGVARQLGDDHILSVRSREKSQQFLGIPGGNQSLYLLDDKVNGLLADIHPAFWEEVALHFLLRFCFRA